MQTPKWMLTVLLFGALLCSACSDDADDNLYDNTHNNPPTPTDTGTPPTPTDTGTPPTPTDTGTPPTPTDTGTPPTPSDTTDTETGDTSDTGADTNPDVCDAGTTQTAWATDCRTSKAPCTAGTWTARSTGSDGHPLRAESEHFALYWFTSDPDGTGPLLGLANPPNQTTIDNALARLESIWEAYFGAPVFFPEPYCNSATKTKAAVHLDDFYPLWGGGWGSNYMGLWVGVGALNDQWGLAHEFMHGVQATTAAFADCGGTACWIYESHANWMPHQIWRNDVHCAEMLVNSSHLYYGSTRTRYCNWQFFEFLKDKHCYSAVHDMWAATAPSGQRDPWQKLMRNQDWTIEQLNDLFGEWAMHNITWDYRNPPPTDQSNQSSIYRNAWGTVGDDPGTRTARRLRRTRLEALNESWQADRRFVSPYYWAPQRWGYNVIELFPEAGASDITVAFRGVIQDGANTGFRYGLVATDSGLTTSRYSQLKAGTDGAIRFCVSANERIFLVVTATPTQYQNIPWTAQGDGPSYASLYRYPYMIALQNAWPEGFRDGTLDACPAGTVRHSNGNGCAPASTPSSVYVGPYARVLGGTVSGNARIEDQATIISGTVSGGTVGALSVVGVQSHPGHGAASFNVRGSAVLQSTFYPLGWFANNASISGTARYLGDLEVWSNSKTSGNFWGLVDDGWAGVDTMTEVTAAPPYTWRN